MQEKTKRETSVRFSWFPEGQYQRDFFLKGLAKESEKVRESKNPLAKVDYEIVSVFKPRRSRVLIKLVELFKNNLHGDVDTSLLYPYRYDTYSRKPGKRLWFTGENIRPPLDRNFDAYFSFDQDSYGGRNFYLPSWIQLLALAENYALPHLGVKLRESTLLSNRQITREKRKFVCVIMRNRNSTRLRAIEALRKFGEVDIYGPAAGSYLPDKFQVASNYKFTLCFENDLYPGYVTEKLIEAYATETVPLYWGDLGDDLRINRKAFINLRDFANLESFAEYVSFISYEKYQEIYEEPFLSRVCNSKDFLQNSLEVIR